MVGVLAAVLLLQGLSPVASNCAQYGCTLSESFTCPTYFYSGSFWPELAESYQDDTWKPTGAGCVTNADKVECPLQDKSKGRNMLMTWNVAQQFASWNLSMQSVVTLPLISYYGETYVTDGSQLCAFQSSDKPFGPCIVMEPVTGPVFDLTVVNEQFLYMLYKCGFMVAFFVSDGSAYASIWLNTTVDGVNGTFIPLSPPAVSGERVYFVAGFKPTNQSAATASSLTLRLYAIDVRTIMVERIKVAWYHEFALKDASIPYLDGPQAQCSGESDPMEPAIGNVLVEDGIVVANLNYTVPATRACSNESCHHTAVAQQSLMLSITDKKDSYSLNFLNEMLPPFQSVVYASPNFTRSKCDPTSAPAPPSVWVSWIVKDGDSTRSKIQNINIWTGLGQSELDIPGIKLTSKMAIFYNDQSMECDDSEPGGTADMLVPLVFGCAYNGSYYIIAVDISLTHAQERWRVETFDHAPPVGQITTVGENRDTMMVVTTTQGWFFYLLYSDTDHKEHQN